MSNVFLKKNYKIFQEISLAEAKLHKKYLLVNCSLPYPVKVRFYEMGLTPNTTVTVTKRAPLGDPIEVNVIEYSVCLRLTEAKCFIVKEVQ